MQKPRRWTRPEKWIVICLLFITSLNLLGFSAAPKTVKVQVDGRTITLSTRAVTVKGALEDAGVVLSDADGYDIAGDGKYEDGSTIEVIRAIPVKVWQHGKTTEYLIGRKTVKEVLDAVGVNYEVYQMYPSLDAPVEAGMTNLTTWTSASGAAPEGSDLIAGMVYYMMQRTTLGTGLTAPAGTLWQYDGSGWTIFEGDLF